MGIEYIVGSVTFIVAVWFRIRVLRPHWCGNLLFFGAAFYCAILLIPESEAALATFVIISGIVTHFCAKGYDKSKSSTQTAKDSSADRQETSNPLHSSTVQSKPPAQPKPPVQQKPQVQSESPIQSKSQAQPKPPVQSTPPAQPKPPVQPKPQVQQTLTTCVRCGKSLRGAKCKHCGFDHMAEPVYLLCLMSPRKLQIQTESTDLSQLQNHNHRPCASVKKK